MNAFEKAKAETKHKGKVFRSTGRENPFALIAYINAITAEAETFRDMVVDNGYVHTIPLDSLKFSWEEK